MSCLHSRGRTGAILALLFTALNQVSNDELVVTISWELLFISRYKANKYVLKPKIC